MKFLALMTQLDLDQGYPLLLAEKMKAWLLVGLMVSYQLDDHKGEAIKIKALLSLGTGYQCEAYGL